MALLSSESLRPYIANWAEVAHYFLRSVQRDARDDGDPQLLTLLHRLLALPDVAALAEDPPPAQTSAPVLPVHFARGDTLFRLFSTIATLGTPRDVALDEVRVECFFPMDDITAELFRAWAAK